MHGDRPVGWNATTSPLGWGSAWHYVSGTAGDAKGRGGAVSGRGFAVVAPMTPPVCSACARHVGHPAGRPHPWGCPVLVRLSAQLLAAADPTRERWRLAAEGCARDAVGGPWAAEARHWRRVRDAAEPPAGLLLTPFLVPTGDGMAERPDEPGTAAPGGGALLLPGTRLRGWLDSQSPGWVFTPPAFGTLDFSEPPSDHSPSQPSPSENAR